MYYSTKTLLVINKNRLFVLVAIHNLYPIYCSIKIMSDLYKLCIFLQK